MPPARYDVIARTFWRRLGQNRGFDLQEATLVEETARRLLQPVAQDDVVLELRPAEVEVPMLEPQLFGGELFSTAARDGNRRSLSRPDDLDADRAQLDIARLHLRVSHLRRSLCDFAFDDDDGFQSKSPCTIDCGIRRPLGVEGDRVQSGAFESMDEIDGVAS